MTLSTYWRTLFSDISLTQYAHCSIWRNKRKTSYPENFVFFTRSSPFGWSRNALIGFRGHSMTLDWKICDLNYLYVPMSIWALNNNIVDSESIGVYYPIFTARSWGLAVYITLFSRDWRRTALVSRKKFWRENSNELKFIVPGTPVPGSQGPPGPSPRDPSY